MAVATEAVKEFKPVTFWLANPQLQLQVKVKGTRKFAKFNNGKFTARTPEEYAAVKATGLAYEADDLKEPILPNSITGYAPQSMRAYQEHEKYIPQG